MTTQKVDAVVVGSGYGGMLTAWKLIRAGLTVALVERGKRVAKSSFKQSWDPIYLGQFFDFGFSEQLNELYRASKVVGGGSIMNSMMHQRVPSESFQFVDPDTGKKAWCGLTRTELNPFYEELENAIGVRQISWNEVPRVGGNFARLFRDAGLSCDPASFNIGRSCTHCGFCEAGCSFSDAKITLTDQILPEMENSGKLVLLTDLSAKRVVKAGGGYKVELVASSQSYRSAAVAVELEAPYVFLGAGPLGTVPLLFRSKESLSGKFQSLGKWISNNGDVNFVFKTPDHYPAHQGHRSTNNSGMISFAFWDQYRVTMHPGFSPVPVMAGVDVRRTNGLAWGLEHKHFVKKHVLDRLIPVNAMRQVPSLMSMSINREGLASVSAAPSKELEKHAAFMLDLAKKVAEPSGGEVLVTGIGESLLDTGGNHILGGARVSDSPERGVCDLNGEVFDNPGLFVVDSSSVPSSLGINPALTVGAMGLRTATQFLNNHRAGV